MVSLEFAMRGGATQDPADKAGLSMLLAGMLDEGAGNLDSQAFQRALDEKAVEIHFRNDREHASGRMRTLIKNLDRAAELLSLALNAPRFDEEPFLRVREHANARLRHDANDPATVAGRSWRSHAFAGHPYGLASEGTIETLAAIERSDLAKIARRVLARDRLSIAVVGAIDEQGRPRWSTRCSPVCRRRATCADRRGDLLRARAGRNDHARRAAIDHPIGRPGLKRDDPDFIPSLVAAHVLGGHGNMTSRLFREVREKRGLAYTVFGAFYALDHGGFFYGGTTTKNERAKESFDVASAEIRDVALNGLNEEELEKGKTYLDRLVSASFRHFRQDRRPTRADPARGTRARLAGRA